LLVIPDTVVISCWSVTFVCLMCCTVDAQFDSCVKSAVIDRKWPRLKATRKKPKTSDWNSKIWKIAPRSWTI